MIIYESDRERKEEKEGGQALDSEEILIHWLLRRDF